MDSDDIRQQLEQTAHRLEQDLRLLEARVRRARQTATTAFVWIAVAAGVATITVVAAALAKRHRRRAALTVRDPSRARQLDGTLPFPDEALRRGRAAAVRRLSSEGGV